MEYPLSEGQIYSYLNFSFEAIFLVDDKGKIEFENSSAKSLFAGESSFWIQDRIPDLDNFFTQEPEVKLGQVIEAVGFHRQKGLFPLVYKIHSLGSSSEKFYIVIKDTSEMTEICLQVQEQEEKLLRSSKWVAIGEMTGGVAHEINTPVTVILGRIQQMRDLVDRSQKQEEIESIDRFKELLQSTEATALRISKIVQGLRRLSRDVSDDTMEERLLRDIVDETLELCRDRFRNNEVQLKWVNECGGAQVLCRGVQLSQVLLNLLNNAYDAVCEFENKWVELKAYQDGESIFIWVTDSGQGIDEKIGKEIFTPFFTTKSNGRGTGLGLSLSQGIIQDHGGRFDIDHQCENTRFVIELPLLSKNS